jgi:hypothetical protein
VVNVVMASVMPQKTLRLVQTIALTPMDSVAVLLTMALALMELLH